MARRVGSKERIRAFLRANVGRVLIAEEIRNASGGASEWARRVRELRNDEGWAIITHNDDRSLKPGEYMLKDDPPELLRRTIRKPISSSLRAHVLDRDGYTCQMCGAGAADVDADNPNRTVRLHVGHIEDRIHGGEDAASNLRALCSACNQGARNLTPDPPRLIWLKSQIRRAKEDDKRALYEWLRERYEKKP